MLVLSSQIYIRIIVNCTKGMCLFLYFSSRKPHLDSCDHHTASN